MIESFGPWSTAIGTGASQQLNTFWKRRLAMLPAVNQPTPGATRRTVLFMAFLAAVALAMPTLRWATQLNSVGAVAFNSADAGEGESARKAAAAEKATAGSKTAEAPPAVEFLPRPSKDEERILKGLAMPIDVNFVDLPLEDCLTFISDYPGMPNLGLYIDKPTLTDEGVALDQPVTLKLKGLRAESVLKLLLRPLQLVFVIEDDILKITTSAKAGEKLITRTHPVRDLYQPGEEIESRDRPSKESDRKEPDRKKDGADSSSSPRSGNEDRRPAATQVLKQGFGGGRRGGGGMGGMGGGGGRRRTPDLIQAITTNIQPDSWEELSGPGSLTYVKEAGSLVIRQTQEIHAEILQLLRDLREAKRMGRSGPDRQPANDRK